MVGVVGRSTRPLRLAVLEAGVLTLIFGLSSLRGCGEGRRIRPVLPAGPTCGQFLDAFGRAVSDTNNNSLPDLPEEASPTVFVSCQGFNPRLIGEVIISFRNTRLAAGPLLLTADRNGNVPPVPIWDLGVGRDGQSIEASGRYDITVTGERRRATFSFEIQPKQVLDALRTNSAGWFRLD